MLVYNKIYEKNFLQWTPNLNGGWATSFTEDRLVTFIYWTSVSNFIYWTSKCGFPNKCKNDTLVGDGEGCVDGAVVGLLVGEEVGALEGCELGEVVGPGVGAWVGEGVGAFVLSHIVVHKWILKENIALPISPYTNILSCWWVKAWSFVCPTTKVPSAQRKFKFFTWWSELHYP